WLKKEIGISATAGLAERHQELALGTELEDLMALGRLRQLLGRHRLASSAARRILVALPVGHPHITVFVHMDAVRKDEHPFAKALDQLAGCVKFEDGRQV